jgi:SAM-dependent methyltransferase
MDPDTAARLLRLNRRFYQTFGDEFSQTRQRLQPGVRRILEALDPQSRLLDLGCGNGQLAIHLVEKGFHGEYVGVDSSAALLAEARKNIPNSASAALIQADLAAPDWDRALSGRQFDVVLAFAILHHLPGEPLRRQVLEKTRSLLHRQGRFIHSQWQFLNSPRLRARLQPWEKAGLQQADVDPGDYLLDWRRGGQGLRYVHHFSEAELQALAKASGFAILETFYSDGETGDLGLYQVWKASQNAG